MESLFSYNMGALSVGKKSGMIIEENYKDKKEGNRNATLFI